MGPRQLYTEEYLKNELLKKTKKLGRTPSYADFKYSTTIARRFGGGIYNNSLIYFGVEPYIGKQNRNDVDCSNYIEIYNSVLDGTVKRFPRYFWEDISILELKKLLKYFFEKKLEWTIKDIKNNLNIDMFYEYKLHGLLIAMFDGSPFKLVNFVYPNKIKEWELKHAPSNFWTKDKCIEVTKYLLEKEKWTDEDIRTKSIRELFTKYGTTSILSTSTIDTYSLIDSIYPNKFKPCELSSCMPKNYWNVDTGKAAIKWMIEEKLMWSDEDIKENYSMKIIVQFKLAKMLKDVFDSNLFEAINSAYPNKFKPYELLGIPKNYWNIEMGKDAIKWMIEEKLMWSNEDIKENYCFKIIKQFKFEKMLKDVFNGNLFEAIDSAYPNKFKEVDFYRVSKDYWTKEKAIESIKNAIDKLGELSNEDLAKKVSSKFFIDNNLNTPFLKFFNRKPHLVLNEIYPERFHK